MNHHIHSVIVSYNREELTATALHSYFTTVTLPFTLVVVDNGSAKSAVTLISSLRDDYPFDFLALDENRFPGYATNRGWELMPPQTTLLHRADNDFSFLPGWCDEIVRRFKNPRVGQLGLRTDKEELKARSNVGGNNVILRALWDLGLRYDERPWGVAYPAGWTEDSLLSPAVRAMGYEWKRVRQPCIVSLSREDPSDPYYQRTWALRGITPPDA